MTSVSISSCVRALTTSRCSWISWSICASTPAAGWPRQSLKRLRSARSRSRSGARIEGCAPRAIHRARLVGLRLRLTLLAAHPLGNSLFGTELIAALGHPHFVLQRGIVVEAGAARPQRRRSRLYRRVACGNLLVDTKRRRAFGRQRLAPRSRGSGRRLQRPARRVGARAQLRLQAQRLVECGAGDLARPPSPRAPVPGLRPNAPPAIDNARTSRRGAAPRLWHARRRAPTRGPAQARCAAERPAGGQSSPRAERHVRRGAQHAPPSRGLPLPRHRAARARPRRAPHVPWRALPARGGGAPPGSEKRPRRAPPAAHRAPAPQARRTFRAD